jgi:hypothetical protein
MSGKGNAVAKNQAEMIEIGSRVRYVGASAGTEQRTQGRVGTAPRLATRQGMGGTNPPQRASRGARPRTTGITSR